jgi:pyruvate,orthophosphate dikinase
MSTSSALTQKPDVVVTVKLKGRATAPAISDAVGYDAAPVLEELVQQGDVEAVKSFYKITPVGTETVVQTLGLVQATLAPSRLASSYDTFCATNGNFKNTITDWQLRPVKGSPVINDHSDHRYDKAVLDRLHAIHGEITHLLGDFSSAFHRYGRYRERFERALQRVVAGQREYMASPAVDSYHSVWFELHEELIMLCGLTRAGEAEAGRG